MLRINHIDNDLDYFFGKMDEEFCNLENIIKSILNAIDVYDSQIEVDKQNQNLKK